MEIIFSWYAVIAIAVLVVIGFIVMAVCLTPAKPGPSVPMSFEEAQPPGVRRVPFFWGGRWLPHKSYCYHFSICGMPRSGKSLLLLLYLRSVLTRITPGSDQRMVLFDPKNAMHPFIFEHAKVPVYYFLPSDWRSSAWDLARDFTNPAAIKEFCHAVVPDPAHDANPFFTKAVRELMIGVMSSLNITQRGKWDLADVVRILESYEHTTEVLNRTPHTRSKLRFMGNQKTWSNIEATLETELNDLRIVAAMWSRARTKFSLTDFVKSEGVLILGRDPRFAALLDKVNLQLLTQLSSQLLAQNDSTSRRTYLAIDELTVAAGEDRPLPFFKDICERGASRGVVITVAFQSYADVKALYKEVGEAILGMFHHQVYLRAGDYLTAEFAMKNYGRDRDWITITSTSTSNSLQGGSSSTTHTPHWHDVDVVPFEKFLELDLATPGGGIWGYRRSAGRADAGLFHLPGSWVEANLPKRSEEVLPYLMRPDSHQYLVPLSYADLKRLKLSLPEGDGATCVALAPASHTRERAKRRGHRSRRLPARRTSPGSFVA